MNRTERTLLQLHDCMCEYARTRSVEYGLEDEEIEDVVSAAYLKAQDKLQGVKVRKNRLSAIRTIAWCELMNELERRNCASERILREAVRLDARTKDEDGESCAIDVTDGRARHDVTAASDWLELTRFQIGRERGMNRKVVTQLQKADMSYAKIRDKFKLTRTKFYAILKKLRNDFAQCFQAYQQCLAEEFAARYQIHLVNTSEGHDGGEVPSQEPLAN